MNQIYDMTFHHPSRWIIYGPSQSGKSNFTLKFIDKLDDMFNVKFQRIIYCCNTFNPIEMTHREIEVYPELDENLIKSLNPKINNFLIIDDQMEDLINNQLMSRLFTKISSHYNLTIFFLTQNLFPKSKYMRNICINACYLVFMRNPGEKLQIRLFSHRISDDKNDKRFIEAYKIATKEPYGYLLVDLTQNTPDILRYRTNFLNQTNSQIVFF